MPVSSRFALPVAGLLACLMISTCSKQAQAASTVAQNMAWASLVQAERDFSQLSIKEGIRDSSLANFAEDALTFPDGAETVVGNDALRKSAKGQGILSWEPIKAEVAASGDWGYTTGPYEYRAKRLTDAPVDTGNYVSVWKRGADGAWKVAADFGCACPPGYSPPELAPMTATSKPAGVSPDVSHLDAAFFRSDDLSCQNYRDCLAPDAKYFRDGSYPVTGADAILAVLRAHPVRVRGTQQRSDAAASGDYCLTTGIMDATPLNASTGTVQKLKYLHIWRRRGRGPWKLVPEIANSRVAAS